MKLNERQKQCLRLVYDNLEAKEIARQLGLSPHTVTEHLRDARRVLGVSRSMHAARALVEWEREHEANPLVPKPIRVAVGPDSPAERPRALGDLPRASGGNRYNLSVLHRLGIIVGIAFATMALAGALVTGSYAVTRLLKGNQIDLSDSPYRH